MTSKNLRLAKEDTLMVMKHLILHITHALVLTLLLIPVSVWGWTQHIRVHVGAVIQKMFLRQYTPSLVQLVFRFFPLVCFPMCMVRDVDEILVWPLPRPFFQGYSPLLLARGGHTENLQVAAEMRSLCGGLKMCLASVVPDFGKACARNMDNYESKYISYALHLHIIANRGKFRSQASEKMDRWKSRGGKSQRREETNWEDQRRERVRRKEMQVREKVEKSRFTVFFQWFVAPEDWKVGSLKLRMRSHLARWEMKNCTPLWREAHFEVKMHKTAQLRSTFRSWDFEKVHIVVARSTCRSHVEVKMYKAPQCRATFGSWNVEKVHAVVRSTCRSQKCKNGRSWSIFWS